MLLVFVLVSSFSLEKADFPSQKSIMGLKGEIKMMVSYSFAEEQKNSDTAQAFIRIIRYFDRKGYEISHEYRVIPYWSEDGIKLTRTVNNYEYPNQIRWNEYDSAGVAVRTGATVRLSAYLVQDTGVDLVNGQTFRSVSYLNQDYRETGFSVLYLDEKGDTVIHESTGYMLKNGHPIGTYKEDFVNDIKDTSDFITTRYDKFGNPTETLIEWRNESQSKRYYLRYFTYY